MGYLYHETFDVIQETDMTAGMTDHKKRALRCFALIAFSFFLTSSGYLSWLYHLMPLVSAGQTDLLSMSVGYAAQAAGILMFCVLIYRRADLIGRSLYSLLMILFFICLVPSVLSAGATGTIVFGLLLNICCGLIAGYYLYALSLSAGVSRRGRIYGYGYAVSALMTWVVSLIGRGSFLRSPWSLLLYAATAALCAWLGDLPGAGGETGENHETTSDESFENVSGNNSAAGSVKAGKTDKKDIPAGNRRTDARLGRKTVLMIGFTLFLICLVKNLGFGFPSADVHSGISIELSRLVYAAGLICAGYVNDRSRKYGAVCTLAALVTPFIMLTLARESVPHIILWNIDYLTFGFFSVYRVLLFTDLADRQKLPCLAGAGLMIGRLGDAAGNLLNHLLREYTAPLVLTASALFALTVFLFVRMYQDLYLPAAVQQKTDREIFEHFAVRHDLSVREKEVLRYLLDGCTNSEIAEKLFVSESTVKFHVHNLLQKTGCSGRAQLRSAYLEQR